MPFIRNADSHGSQPLTDTRKLFIGRIGELRFFVKNVLKPENNMQFYSRCYNLHRSPSDKFIQ